MHIDNINKHTYEISKPYIDNFRIALDVGARNGDYAKYLAEDFDHSHCFEPRQQYKKRFKRALENNLNKATWHPVALGEEEKNVTMIGPVVLNLEDKQYKSKKGGVVRAVNRLAKKFSELNVKQKRLDDYSFDDVDYIKIDVEGHELNVLKGAVKTIERCKPIIVIEQNRVTERYGKGNKFDAKNFLISLGYEVVAFDMAYDYILKYK